MCSMNLQCLKLLDPTVKEQMYLEENVVFYLDLGVKVTTQDVAQYPLHHMTCAPVKFEVATSNGKGVSFTKKYSI